MQVLGAKTEARIIMRTVEVIKTGLKALYKVATEVRTRTRCLVCMSVGSPAQEVAHATRSASLDRRKVADFVKSYHYLFWDGHTALDPEYQADILAWMVA